MNRSRLLALLLPVSLLAGCYSLAGDITPPPGYVYTTPIPSVAPTEVMYFPLMPPDPDAGATTYVDKCEPCHGPSGFGDGPTAAELPNPVAPIGDPDLARQRTMEDWFRQVTEGNIERYMPPFTSLSERERWDVVAYAFSLSLREDEIALGETLYQDNCAACHGAAGAGDGPDAAGLPVAPAPFTDQAAMAEMSLNDLVLGIAHPDFPEQPAFVADLSAADQFALAAFVRSFSFAGDAPVAGEPGMPGTGSVSVTPTAAAETPPVVIDGPEAQAGTLADVAGQVIKLSGGDPPADLEVILYGFDQFQQTFTRTQTIAADGSFLFEEVEMPPGRAFIVSVEYDRATYTSDLAVVEGEARDIFLQVTVFESSADTSTLSIDRMHIFFEFLSADTVRVAELILITNPTDRLVIAETDGQPTIEISLPAGAQNLQFEDGDLGSQFVLLPDGFGDLRGIQPGVAAHQILFSFDLPYEREFTLDQSVDFPVSALVVLLPDVGVELVNSTLSSDGSREVEGLSYQLFTGGSIPAGERLPINLSGTPNFGSGAGITGGDRGTLAIGMTALGVILVGVGIWLYRRQRGGVEPDAEEDEEPLPEHISVMNDEDLMDAIIALDDRYKAGDLPEGAYLKQRSLLKHRLQEVKED